MRGSRRPPRRGERRLRRPAPPGVTTLPGHANARSSATLAILEAVDRLAPNGRLHQTLLVEELQPKDGGDHTELPVALVPSKVLSTKPIDDALAEVAQRVVDADDELPRPAGIDLLARRLPRLRGDAPLPGVGVGPTRHVDAIEAALLATDDSYLAVQGPPGTGKTYVASRVIARLVLDHGWAVGVTSQGHKAIENVLRAVVAAGVPAEQVGKATRDPEGATWTTLDKADDLAEFAAGHVRGRPGLRRRRHRLGPHEHQAGRPRPARPRRRRRGGAVLARQDPRLLGGR